MFQNWIQILRVVQGSDSGSASEQGITLYMIFSSRVFDLSDPDRDGHVCMFVHAKGLHKWPCKAGQAIFLRGQQMYKKNSLKLQTGKE